MNKNQFRNFQDNFNSIIIVFQGCVELPFYELANELSIYRSGHITIGIISFLMLCVFKNIYLFIFGRIGS